MPRCLILVVVLAAGCAGHELREDGCPVAEPRDGQRARKGEATFCVYAQQPACTSHYCSANGGRWSCDEPDCIDDSDPPVETDSDAGGDSGHRDSVASGAAVGP